jgi:hypothetical protein
VIAGIGFGTFIGGCRGAGGDPFPELCDLRWRVGLAFVLGRHAILGIGGGDAFEEGAGVRLAGNEHRTGLPAAAHEFDGIEAEVGLLLEGPVTREATFLEEGPDLGGVINGSPGRRRDGDQEDRPREPSEERLQTGLEGTCHAGEERR